jgi:hypothetical protein
MNRILLGIVALLAGAAVAPAQTSQAPASQASIELWRLDCGDFVMKRYNACFPTPSNIPKGKRPWS